MHLSTLPIILLLGLSLIGCNRDARLHGRWKFDRMYTESQLSKEKEASANDDGLQSMKKQLASMLAPMLVEKLDGSFITIRPKEMVFTMNEGTGKAWAYEIIERPAKDTWLVKTGDGQIQTYAREGERLSCPATGDLQFKAYYLQVQK